MYPSSSRGSAEFFTGRGDLGFDARDGDAGRLEKVVPDVGIGVLDGRSICTAYSRNEARGSGLRGVLLGTEGKVKGGSLSSSSIEGNA